MRATTSAARLNRQRTAATSWQWSHLCAGCGLAAVSCLMQLLLFWHWARHDVAHGQQLLAWGSLIIMAWILIRSKAQGHLAEHLDMAALSGSGMLLGTWLDWHLTTPACLCCIYDGQQPTYLIWWRSLQDASTWMMLSWPLPLRLFLLRNTLRSFSAMPYRQAWAKHLQLAGLLTIEGLGMLLGMWLMGWLGASLIRAMAPWKLELGYLLMWIGMVGGCALAGVWGRRLLLPGNRT